jgi:hypothetical protein
MSEQQDYEWYETPYGKFRVEQKRFGTWTSYSKDGEGILTTLSKEHLISSTRWYLQAKQEGFPDPTIQYDGTVGGKL